MKKSTFESARRRPLWLLATVLALVACERSSSGSAEPSESTGEVKSPEALCKHLGTFMPDWNADECALDFDGVRTLDAKGYQCLAKCISGVKTKDAYESCEHVCEKLSPTLQARASVKRDAAAFGGDSFAASRWELTKPFLVGSKQLRGSLDAEGGALAFAITLHEDMIATIESGSSVLYGVDPEKHDPSVVEGPLVTVDLRTGTPSEALAAIAEGLEESTKVEKKESNDSSYVLATSDSSSVRVQVGVMVQGKLVGCEALLASGPAAVKKAEVLPALEKLCRSVTAG